MENDPNGGSFNGAAHPSDLHHRKPRSSELPKGNSESRSSVSHDDMVSISGDDSPNPGGGGGILDDCGLLPNNCLPCMASAVGVNEKKRALSTSPTHSMKMPSLKLSFKKKSGEANPSSALCKHFFIHRWVIVVFLAELHSLPASFTHATTVFHMTFFRSLCFGVACVISFTVYF
jgi:hypothetical protein